MADPAADNWFTANPRKAKWLIFLLCFGFLEILCRVLVAIDLLPHRTYPTNREPVFYAYIDPVVGIWRFPNKTIQHETDCFSVALTANSAGARDVERSLDSDDPRRVVVLGDSMVEGHGLPKEQRSTDLLERATGIEHLNFGTSGSFGTIQEWLYYREYASRYDHSDVFLFILPANDFNDNDPAAWEADVYRPFLRPAGDSYELYYPVEFEDRYTGARGFGEIVKNTIDNNVYVLNAARVGIRYYKELRKAERPAEARNYYDSYSAEDLRVILHALRELITEAADRPVHIFTIPLVGDLEFARQHGYDFELVRELNTLASGYRNVRYTDLLPPLMQYVDASDIRFRDLTLGCDSHWGARGARAVADIVRAVARPGLYSD